MNNINKTEYKLLGGGSIYSPLIHITKKDGMLKQKYLLWMNE